MGETSTDSTLKLKQLRQEIDSVIGLQKLSLGANVIWPNEYSGSGAILKEIEKVQKKQEEESKVQNQLMKELLDELRFARMEIAEMRKKQEKDSDTLELVWEKSWQMEEYLQNPATFELKGRWQKTYSGLFSSDMRCYGIEWLNSHQYFRMEGNSLIWSHSQKKQSIVVAKVRVGSDRCKIIEDGKIEIETDKGDKFELEAKGNSLSIQYNDMKVNYKKCT